MDRRLLFVMGIARSGTTALTELLNAHPDIALGMERYKLLVHGAADELGPSLFEPARFFDFAVGQTNITPDLSPRWAAYYQALAEKYDAAAYVGDKVTGIRIRRILGRFPSARMVVIVRDPVEVAASWQRRADDPADHGWRSGRGSTEAVVEWNAGLRRLLTVSDRAVGRIRVVEHRTLFGDPSGAALHGTLEWLGLSASPAVAAAFERMHGRYVSRLRDRPVALPSADREAVAARADREAWRAVLRLAD